MPAKKKVKKAPLKKSVSSQPKKPISHQPKQKRTKVLLVESDLIYAEMLVAVLERENLTVDYYKSMAALLQKMPENDFDVVIIDNDLGQINGVNSTST